MLGRLAFRAYYCRALRLTAQTMRMDCEMDLQAVDHHFRDLLVETLALRQVRPVSEKAFDHPADPGQSVVIVPDTESVHASFQLSSQTRSIMQSAPLHSFPALRYPPRGVL